VRKEDLLARSKLKKISEAAKVTEEDIKNARAMWEKDAPPKYRLLLDADIIPDIDA
jgi:hypothetical protein